MLFFRPNPSPGGGVEGRRGGGGADGGSLRFKLGRAPLLFNFFTVSSGCTSVRRANAARPPRGSQAWAAGQRGLCKHRRIVRMWDPVPSNC